MTERCERLSPSSAATFLRCPAEWYDAYFLGFPQEPPTEAMVRGTFVHRVLELLMGGTRPRTPQAAKECAKIAWEEMADDIDFCFGPLDDESMTTARHEFRWAAWERIEQFFTLTDLLAIDVWACEYDLDLEIGGVPFVGQIDLVEDRTLGLQVWDYKAGDKPEGRYAAEKEATYLFQPKLYGAALRALGHRVQKVGLWFLGDRPGELSQRVDDAALDRAVETLQAVWVNSRRVIAAGARPEGHTGPLCGWCDFLDHCPEGQREVRVRISMGRNVGPGAAVV